MEPLNLMITLNLVSDDVRREVTGGGVAPGRRPKAPKEKKSRRAWSALWRKVVSRKSPSEVHPSHVTVLR
jgi:hypothetical protein